MARRDLPQVAYTVREAADATGMSEHTIRRAIHATDPAAFPPPLVGAKRAGEGRNASYRIPAKALEAWIDSFPDA